MGAVFEARHQLLGINVALKFLHSELNERPGLAARFLQEGRVSATIKSPHVVRVSDVDTADDGSPFLVMELLQGESLQDLLNREHKLLPARAVGFALQILSGLETAHRLGVVHRDLKPDNVFIIETEKGPLIKLIDFGIAKLRDTREYREVVTLAGTMMGTPEYMPPEQLYAAEQVDERADLYSVGVLLYEMLSGQFPAAGENASEIVTQVQLGRITSLAEREPELPHELVEVVHRAMLPDREHRFQTASEFKEALVPFVQPRIMAPVVVSPPKASTAQPAAPPIVVVKEQVVPRVPAAPAEPTGLSSAVMPEPVARAAAPEPPDLKPEPFVEDRHEAQGVYEKGDTEPGPTQPPYAPPRVAVPLAPPTQGRPRRTRGGLVASLVFLASVLGAGVVALYVYQKGPSSSPPELPPPTPTVPPKEVLLSPQVSPSEPGSASTPVALPPPPEPKPPAPRPTASPKPKKKVPSFPFPIPSALPSTLPPLPSGFPTALPSALPTSLPTAWPSTFPTLPGVFPPPTGTTSPVAPAPSASSSPSTSPSKPPANVPPSNPSLSNLPPSNPSSSSAGAAN